MTRSRNLNLALTLLCALALLLAAADALAGADCCDKAAAAKSVAVAAPADDSQAPDAAAPADAKFKQDRAAILAMAGEYRVDFQFQETVAVEPGYELKDPYHSGATEFVEVIEDTGDTISLQHVLVLHPEDGGEAHVVKHWRQDWRYEDTQLTEFRGNRTWKVVELAPEQVEGKWTQAVFQVDDSPRYEGIGEWTHTGGRSAWESAETWRPLPRREYTKRDDYQVLVARNRHTITPQGWVHEQDNYKLVLDQQGGPKKVLAHESGLNVYDRVDDVDFAAGRMYWDATDAYWQDVRAVWADLLDEPGEVSLRAKVDGKRMHQVMFALAEDVKEAGSYDPEAMRPVIRQRIESFVAE